MAIILWALYPLSPWRRLHEVARHLLQSLLNVFADPQAVDWLCADPDDPEGIARVERSLDDLDALTNFLVYQKARVILGLRHTRWLRPQLSPPQRRRVQSLDDLIARLEACAQRFADVERLARRRAWKLKRLLKPSEVQLAEPAHAIFTNLAACLPQSLYDWRGRCIASTIARTCERDGGGSPAGILSHRAGLRVRAPP
jgi:hypothetical protein